MICNIKQEITTPPKKFWSNKRIFAKLRILVIVYVKVFW